MKNLRGLLKYLFISLVRKPTVKHHGRMWNGRREIEKSETEISKASLSEIFKT